MPHWNWRRWVRGAGFLLIILNSKLRGAQNTKHKWEGPSSGKWACWVSTLSVGIGKKQHVDHFEVGHEVRDIRVIINYKQELLYQITSNIHVQVYFASKFSLPSVSLGIFGYPKWQMYVWWWQWQDLGCYIGSLFMAFPFQSVNFASWLRWTKESQYGIWGVFHNDCHQEEECLLTCRPQLRHGHLIPNKDMLYSTWYCTQYSVMSCMGK